MIHYKAEGTQAKGHILFIHGMCHGAWCWDFGFMQAFVSAGYHCSAIDLPGHEQPGRNRKVNHFGLSDYLASVDQALSTIGKDAIIIGHSMGGFITQKYLEQKTCKAAVLLAPVPYFGILAPSLRYISHHPMAFFHLLAQDIYRPFVAHAEELFHSLQQDLTIEQVQALMRSESFKVLIGMMAKPVKKPTPKQVPLLVLGGAEDQVISPLEIERTAHFHRVAHHLFSNCGHNMMLESVSSEVTQYILSWLDQIK